MMKLKRRATAKPPSPRSPSGRSSPGTNPAPPVSVPAQGTITLTGKSGDKITISVHPDGSASVARSGPRPPEAPARLPPWMVFQGRFGKIAIGVDPEGRFHVGRQVRPLRSRARKPNSRTAKESSVPASGEPAPWDESDPWDESV